jgi:hypothetical protein
MTGTFGLKFVLSVIFAATAHSDRPANPARVRNSHRRISPCPVPRAFFRCRHHKIAFAAIPAARFDRSDDAPAQPFFQGETKWLRNPRNIYQCGIFLKTCETAAFCPLLTMCEVAARKKSSSFSKNLPAAAASPNGSS